MIRSTLDRRTLDGPTTTVSEGYPEQGEGYPEQGEGYPEQGETTRVLYIEYHRPRGYGGPVVVVPSRKADGKDTALQSAELVEVVAEARKVWEAAPEPKPIDDKPTDSEGRARQ